MKFKLKGDQPLRMYGDKMLSPGDTVEYTGHIAEKALKNPDLERVIAASKPKRSKPQPDAGVPGDE